MIKLKVEGMKEALARLGGFSARRMNAAVATALTRTGRVVQDDWKRQLSVDVDRPTQLTARAPVIQQATAAKLQTEVRLRDAVSNGQPPSTYLQPLERGGGRVHKKFEKALIAQGSMPRGSYAVPTDNATRDGYGNVSRGQLVQILVQLAGGVVRDGYRRVISKSAARRAQAAVRSGKEYVAVLAEQGGMAPGIYARLPEGKYQMVFAYERNVRYKRQLSLRARAKRIALQTFPAELSRAIDESAQRLRARGR